MIASPLDITSGWFCFCFGSWRGK